MWSKFTTQQLINHLDSFKFTRKINQLHIHHTWKPTHKQFTGSNHQKMQDGIRNSHVNSNGWSEIGQHLTLFPDGIWLSGRDFNKTPASIENFNTGAIAIEMIGNFDIEGRGVPNSLGYDVFEGEQKKALMQIIKYAQGREWTIVFHNEHSAKTCPGTSINKSKLLAEVSQMSDKLTLQIQPETIELEDVILQNGKFYVGVREILGVFGYGNISGDAEKRIVKVGK